MRINLQRTTADVVENGDHRRRGFRGLVVLLLILVASRSIAQDTPDYYRQNCMNCHTIGGGRLTGPDLKNVRQRREVEWLISFMQNPKAMIESGDPYAVKLADESRGVVIVRSRSSSCWRRSRLWKSRSSKVCESPASRLLSRIKWPGISILSVR
jgi:hypothetical protein